MVTKKIEKDFFPAEAIYPPDFLELVALTPAERLARSAELWDIYLAYGGSLEPDIDPQSPFFDPEEQESNTTIGSPTGLPLIRRS